MVWRCNDDGSTLLPEPLSHHTAAIVAVANKDSGVAIDELLHVLVVMLASRSEDECCESVLVVNGGMELGSVVPALPVLAELGDTLGDLVSVCAYQTTDRQQTNEATYASVMKPFAEVRAF